jgi:hypothetical protein
MQKSDSDILNRKSKTEFFMLKDFTLVSQYFYLFLMNIFIVINKYYLKCVADFQKELIDNVVKLKLNEKNVLEFLFIQTNYFCKKTRISQFILMQILDRKISRFEVGVHLNFFFAIR